MGKEDVASIMGKEGEGPKGGKQLEQVDERLQIKQERSAEPDKVVVSWPENQGILFFYISKTLQMNRISFMASLLNAVL